MNSKCMDNKSNKIQILRAVAIMCVVVIHTTPSGKWAILSRPVTNLSVATFFFLSGYLTTLDIKDKFSFFKKRISRVLIPYIIWVTLYSIAYNDYKRIFINYFTASQTVSVHFYYVLVYIQFVLISPFLKKIIYSKFRFLGWLISPLSTIGFLYIPLFMGVELNSVFSYIWVNGLLGWFIFYYLGIMLGNHVIEINIKRQYVVILYLISVFVQMLETYVLWEMGFANCGTQIKFSAFITSILAIILEYMYIESGNKLSDKKYNSILKMIGDCSFGIYLSHFLIISALKHFVSVYCQIPFLINSLLIIIISFLCVCIGRKICGKKLGRYFGLY